MPADACGQIGVMHLIGIGVPVRRENARRNRDRRTLTGPPDSNRREQSGARATVRSEGAFSVHGCPVLCAETLANAPAGK
ncbi:hypothetical protein MPPM_0017 [Methylorubrum populi]|uniref:Uncharacterized protein n=1 Tax=Methylorubrum populi TaxID=223967 RepID=A0A161JKV6_9HYPH|nr:hypothetical protein MPPM_0017 [Methylorubrum populi]